MSFRCCGRLPLGSRKLVAEKLACIVEGVVQANDNHAQSKLLHFSPRYLKLPKGGNKHKTKTYCPY